MNAYESHCNFIKRFKYERLGQWLPKQKQHKLKYEDIQKYFFKRCSDKKMYETIIKLLVQ